MSQLAYQRVLLKLSGESLLGASAYGIGQTGLDHVADQLIQVKATGVELAVVIGAGNIFRGMAEAAKSGMTRAVADNMGMLATVINALAVQDAMLRKGVDARVMTAFPIQAVAEVFTRARAIAHLEEGKVLILAAGTGHPYFTTDTAAALRAAELNCEVLLKATTVDGVYDKDPKKFPDAKRFEKIANTEFLHLDLQAMDATAVSLSRASKLPILVFDLSVPDNIIKVLHGEKLGTLISEV